MEFEGYLTKLANGDCKAYLDKLVRPELRSPGYAGLWTIGWGSTGPDVTEGTVWTREKAEARLAKTIAAHAKSVERAVKVPLTQSMFDALVSSSYNISGGINAMHTLLARLNAGDYEGAAEAFKLYNKAGGVAVRGLTRRRAAERKLFLAEGVTPRMTRKLVVDNSTKLSFLENIRLFLLSLGVGGWLSWDNLSQAKVFAADHIGLMLLILGAVTWVIFKWVEWMSVKDYKKGNYVPSGLADASVQEGEEA